MCHLGYAVFEVWRQITARGAYFLSRWRADFRLFEPQTQQPLDLLAVLQNQAQLSRQVLLGVEELLPVRLVALRLPAPLAAQRRRRARANARRDSALRLSQRYLKLLEWTILLTNVPDERLSAQQVLEFYSYRWQIEVLFKSWKSQFRIGRLPTSNPLQVQIQLLARLLAITLLQNLFSPNLMASKDLLLSPLKTAAYFSVLLPLIAACPTKIGSTISCTSVATTPATTELTSSRSSLPYVDAHARLRDEGGKGKCRKSELGSGDLAVLEGNTWRHFRVQTALNLGRDFLAYFFSPFQECKGRA